MVSHFLSLNAWNSLPIHSVQDHSLHGITCTRILTLKVETAHLHTQIAEYCLTWLQTSCIYHSLRVESAQTSCCTFRTTDPLKFKLYCNPLQYLMSIQLHSVHTAPFSKAKQRAHLTFYQERRLNYSITTLSPSNLSVKCTDLIALYYSSTSFPPKLWRGQIQEIRKITKFLI